MSIIAIMTDFGRRGAHYIAEMKGVAWNIASKVNIVDISHEITPYSVLEAAYVLFSTYSSFPKKTIFVAVIDPSVGSDRDLIAIQTTDDYILIGPNNGIFSYFIHYKIVSLAIKITAIEYFNPPYIDAIKRIRNKKSISADLGDSINSAFEDESKKNTDLEKFGELNEIINPKLPPDFDTHINQKHNEIHTENENNPNDKTAFQSPLGIDELIEKESSIELPEGLLEAPSHILDNLDQARKDKFNALELSQTFHGRDIMMPVAAHLANGLNIFSLGEPTLDLQLIENIEPEVSDDKKFITALIQYIDSFGNIITNIPIVDFQLLSLSRDVSFSFKFHGKTSPIKLVPYFAGNEPEELLLIGGSSGFLEICQNQANAAINLNAKVGEEFQIELIGSAFSEFFE